MADLPQLPPLPESKRPIVMIGAGGIVNDAHLPAYRIAGFDVHSLYDLRYERAVEIAGKFGISHVPHCLGEAVQGAPVDTIFDIAVPAHSILEVLSGLPDGSAVLIQKPMGENITQAKAILDHCRSHRLVAAVNFQLRYAPFVSLAREMIARGMIGELHDIEVRLTIDTPWHLWTFLNDIPRMEILYHSIHYIDTIRSFCGEPVGVYAKTMGHPRMPRIRQARSTIILDYGEKYRATITANHGHNYGPRHQESYIKWEGTNGAIKATIGLLLDYPHGKPDTFEYFIEGEEDWKSVSLEGSWFPHAFVGPMASLMRFIEGTDVALPTSVDDAYQTMCVVEAAYLSSDHGATMVVG